MTYLLLSDSIANVIDGNSNQGSRTAAVQQLLANLLSSDLEEGILQLIGLPKLETACQIILKDIPAAMLNSSNGQSVDFFAMLRINSLIEGRSAKQIIAREDEKIQFNETFLEAFETFKKRYQKYLLSKTKLQNEAATSNTLHLLSSDRVLDLSICDIKPNIEEKKKRRRVQKSDYETKVLGDREDSIDATSQVQPPAPKKTITDAIYALIAQPHPEVEKTKQEQLKLKGAQPL